MSSCKADHPTILKYKDMEFKEMSGLPVDVDAHFEGAQGLLVAPPAPMPETITEPRTLLYDAPSLDSEDIFKACKQDESFFSRSNLVKQMQLTDISNMVIYHCSLESFGESRMTSDSTTPYCGEPIDGPENGSPPDPLDMEVIYPPSPWSEDWSEAVDIPHTETVSSCVLCGGVGRIQCESCPDQRAGLLCTTCGGTKRFGNKVCTSCDGTGYRRRCVWCDDSGETRCETCYGYGKIKHSKTLCVKWETVKDECFPGVFCLPLAALSYVDGKILLDEEHEQVSPIDDVPDPCVREASTIMIERHRSRFQRIIKQKQTLTAYPLTEVMYKWKTEEGELYVYGEEKRVYFENYPLEPCCTCF